MSRQGDNGLSEWWGGGIGAVKLPRKGRCRVCDKSMGLKSGRRFMWTCEQCVEAMRKDGSLTLVAAIAFKPGITEQQARNILDIVSPAFSEIYFTEQEIKSPSISDGVDVALDAIGAKR